MIPGPMLILDGYANLAESDTVYTHNLMCKGKMDYKVLFGKTKVFLKIKDTFYEKGREILSFNVTF
jgi:hypothetical protein